MSLHLQNVLAGQTLSRPDAESLMNDILAGAIPSERLAALLVALRFRGEKREELSGFVRALRRHAVSVPFSGKDIVDTCGTGGDASGTFNISTAAALVVAACGVKVAKHGNRSASSKCGSADVLESLGLVIEQPVDAATMQLAQSNFCFLFAPRYHPSLAKIRPLRIALGIPTVFNLLGPLLNPARVDRQVIGVSNPALLVTFAEILRDEETTEAFIVHGDGLDEITLSGETQIAHLKDGKIKQFRVSPEDFGLPRTSLAELKGGDAIENAKVIEAIIDGTETGAKLNAVLANAAAALVVSGISANFKEGTHLAKRTIANGNAKSILESLRRKS